MGPRLALGLLAQGLFLTNKHSQGPLAGSGAPRPDLGLQYRGSFYESTFTGVPWLSLSRSGFFNTGDFFYESTFTGATWVDLGPPGGI